MRNIRSANANGDYRKNNTIMKISVRFCPECGTKLEEVFAFCPECGTKLEGLLPVVEQPTEDASTNTDAARPNATFNGDINTNTDAPEIPVAPQEEENSTPVQARGFILTNMVSLAKRWHTNVGTIAEVIDWYVKNMRKLGVVYKVLDASDYTYLKKPLFGAPKHVSLGPANSWYEYADILKDQHDAEVRDKLPETEYVFIIGSDKEVPMPNLPNFVPNDDRSFDTDLLYAYPYGEEMERKLMSQDIFKYDALFYVGRLPLAMDSTLRDLEEYMVRVLENHCMVDVRQAYAQCDPHWRNVTMTITDDLAQYDIFPRYSVDFPNTMLYQDRVFTTPLVMIMPNTGEQYPPVFNREANYIFFNMHGGGGRDARGFYGFADEIGGGEGINPDILSSSTVPNILFTQACYGGKFIGYSKRECMLLTALNTNTLTYVGSSRIAYGAGDNNGGSISASDVLAKAFNFYIMRGFTAGSAFFQARIHTFKHHPGCPIHALTICEFNLYGDPMMHVRKSEDCYKMVSSKSAVLRPYESVGVVREEVLMNKSVGGQQSLLQQVRAAVDKNIMDISASIAKTLYSQYGIAAREPSIISRRTYADGRRELSFTYKQPIEEGLTNDVMAISSEKGELQRVMTSK